MHIGRTRQRFDHLVAGEHQFEIGALQTVERDGVVDDHGGTAGNGLQRVEPLRVGVERRAVEDFQHALQLAARNQRQRVIGDEAFTLEERRTRKRGHAVAQVGDAHHAALAGGDAGLSLADAQARVFERARAKAAAGGKFQLGTGLVQQHVGGVHVQQREQLFEKDVQREAHVERRGHRHVHLVQGLHVGDAAIGLQHQARVANGLRCLLRQRLQARQLFGGEFARGRTIPHG